MKSFIQKLFLVVLLFQNFCVAAASFSVLDHFGAIGTSLHPASPSVSGPDGALYGVASGGEGTSGGNIFKI